MLLGRRLPSLQSMPLPHLLAGVIENIPALLAFKDSKGRYVCVNRAYETFLGRSRDEIIGKTDYNLFPRPLAEAFHAAECRVLDSRLAVNRTVMIPGMDGLRSFATSTFPILDDQGCLQALCRIANHLASSPYADSEARMAHTASLEERNVILEARVRELEAAVEELEAFSYSVSHELQALLRALSGFSGILAKAFHDALPEEARVDLRRVQESARLMSDLVESLLRLSRLGRQALEKRDIRPVELVQDVLDMLAPQLAGRQVEVEVGTLPPCEADPSMLRLVYANLIGNAIKFTRKRSVARITFGARVQDGACHYFVSDNGVGFSMAYVAKLFGAFERLHAKQDFEGTGIGLALVQRIIRRHGGEVWAEGEVDHGATFFFTLPPAAPQAIRAA